MTSIERKENRYQRRKQIREEAKRNYQQKYGSFDNIVDFDNLVKAFLKTRKGVSWKCSIQSYQANLFRNTFRIQDKLRAGKSVIEKTNDFYICERGKVRFIQSVNIKERVVQRAICDECLTPLVTHYTIYDNGASVLKKGFSFAIDRLENHLHSYYRKNKNDGYILKIDFTKYFQNIQHVPLYRMIDKLNIDYKVKILMKSFIDRFGDIGLGLGSQISQMLAIYYINEIEHLIKDQWRYTYYARYMDDSYIIVKTKEEAHELLDKLTLLYEDLGITINLRKTQIISLKHQFTFLKTKFTLTDNGEVIKQSDHSTIKCMRRKLKKFKRFVDDNEMTVEDVYCSLISWKGHMSSKKSYKSIKSIMLLYNELFVKPFNQWIEK